jgi:hypothetical protein
MVAEHSGFSSTTALAGSLTYLYIGYSLAFLLTRLAPALPASMVVALSDLDLDRLYLAGVMGRNAYLHTLNTIVTPMEHRPGAVRHGGAWNG